MNSLFRQLPVLVLEADSERDIVPEVGNGDVVPHWRIELEYMCQAPSEDYPRPDTSFAEFS